jgi:hypothetical protein
LMTCQSIALELDTFSVLFCPCVSRLLAGQKRG